MNKVEFYEDLEKLYKVLPPKVLGHLKEKDLEDLIEIVLDLGRVPEIRRSDGKIEYLGTSLVTEDDISYLTERIEDFASDNRSGIPGTLHRISAIKNRKGRTIGLTCRIGRVVTGTILCIKDIVLQGKSILFLGRPGVGKTTKLREIARTLSDELGKRVVVVDTSNEIAGDGNVPHIAIGHSRRMQVPTPERQKDVMIEAVQNHTPEVIVVDEIGTEEEAMAARTIAERGVMLVATAHGNTLENLIKNPILSDLIGGVNSVTLGDDEARRRATQKTILEREKKPTFDVVIEIIDRDTLSIYTDVAEAVDYILREWPISPEIRKVDQEATIKPAEPVVEVKEEIKVPENVMNRNFNVEKYIKDVQDYKKVYIYAVNRTIVDKAIERLGISAEVTRNIDEADLVIAHKSYSKGGAKILGVARDYRLPIHYVKTNSMPQIQKVLKEALRLDKEPDSEAMTNYMDETEKALDEVKEAVKKLENGATEVSLKPQNQRIRKLQHELIDQHNLVSESIGEGSERHLKVVKSLPNVG
jgi:stage III sporulation protein SpoIIIAA